jgi:hypothetical protein
MKKAEPELVKRQFEELKLYKVNTKDHFEVVMNIIIAKNKGRLVTSFRDISERTHITLSTIHQLSQIALYYNNDAIAVTNDWRGRGNAITVYARKRKAEIYNPVQPLISSYDRVLERIDRYFGDRNNPNREDEANKVIHKLRRSIRPNKALKLFSVC